MIAKSTAMPTVVLLVAVAVLIELSMSGAASVALAGNAAGLIFVALYSVVFVLSQTQFLRSVPIG